MTMPEPFQTGGSDPPRDARRHSIAAKIIFLVFLCTFSTALVISWIAIEASHADLRGRIERGFPAVLERAQGELQTWLAEGRAKLGDFARSPRASAALRAFASGGDEKARTEAVRLLRELAETSPHFDAVAVLADGSRWLAKASKPQAAPFEAGPIDVDAKRSTDATSASGDGGAAFAVAPLVPGDAAAGFIVGRYARSQLEAVLEAERHESPGVVLLADPQGRVLAVAGPDPEARREAAQSVERLREGDRAQVQEYASRSGGHMLGTFAPLSSDPGSWLLVIEAPFATAFAPVLAVVTRIFVTDLLIILVFIAFAYRITTRMLRPIEELSECARLASRGDLGQAIQDPGTHDEIGRLTRAFNEMMGKLRDSQMDLRRANRQLTSQNEELQRANEVLSQLSITDGLTKLHNHRYFQERLTREIKRHGRTVKPLSMLLVDLDDFKALNDRLGHASGDELLVRVASILDANVRESDLLARYGGEEFVVLATETDLDGAVQLAEKIRMAVEQAVHIVNDSLRPIRITVSAGVAQYAGNRRLFFEAADRALYRAKDQGKNCVVATLPDGSLD